MLEVNGQSIIERQLRNLPKNNIGKVVIIIGHRGEKLKEHISNLDLKLNILFLKNDNYKITNCAYSLMLASEFFKDIIIINCDLLFSKQSINRLINNNSSAAVCLRKNTDYQTDLQQAMVKNKIVNWSLRLEESNAEIMGPVKLKEKNSLKILNYFNSLSLVKQKEKHCFSLLSECIDKIDFFPIYVEDNSWFEIDDHNDYKNVKKLLKNSKLIV